MAAVLADDGAGRDVPAPDRLVPAAGEEGLPVAAEAEACERHGGAAVGGGDGAGVEIEAFDGARAFGDVDGLGVERVGGEGEDLGGEGDGVAVLVLRFGGAAGCRFEGRSEGVNSIQRRML